MSDFQPAPKPKVEPKERGKRFEDRRDPAYTGFVRRLPCILKDKPKHRCQGLVSACHLKSRAAGGEDFGNVFPGCVVAHNEQHRVGIHYWAEKWFADPTGSGNGYMILKRIVQEEIPRQFQEEL